MKILVTAFEPFGGESINPSEEILNILPDEIDGRVIVKRMLPTVFGRAGNIIVEAIREERPDAVLSLGQAGGRRGISVERVAINLRDARIADNDGNRPDDEKIRENGENALFATLPIKKIAAAVRDAGFDAHISNSAGTFVCNDVMYTLLYELRKTKNTVGGFIHIPYCREQVNNREGVPFMELSDIKKAVETAIMAI